MVKMNINPKQMQAMMKQMGIKQEEIDALRVIIEKEDSKIIIENPSILKINMQGNESFQISGDIKEIEEKYSETDIETVMNKTNCTRKQAINALEETGDLAEAIIQLSK